jgi:hypothetical protein
MSSDTIPTAAWRGKMQALDVNAICDVRELICGWLEREGYIV